MSEKDIEYIRVAAYYIWENEGRPEGKSEEIWWKACNQIKNWNCSCKSKKSVAKKAAEKKTVAKATKVAVKPAAKIVAKPAVKVATKSVSAKPAAKVALKPAAKLSAKPALKAASVKLPAAKKLAKSKISPVPVKSSAKIITPLYGSLKK